MMAERINPTLFVSELMLWLVFCKIPNIILGVSSLIGLYKPFRLKHYQRRTIAIEVGVQNIQVASGIIVLSQFPPLDLAATLLHPFLYLVSQVSNYLKITSKS